MLVPEFVVMNTHTKPQYNPNLFPVGDGFGLIVFFRCLSASIHTRNFLRRQRTDCVIYFPPSGNTCRRG
jgi:hypothetical protein